MRVDESSNSRSRLAWNSHALQGSRQGGGGGGGAMVRLHPRTRREGPLNLRGRVQMTLRMQEEWTSTT